MKGGGCRSDLYGLEYVDEPVAHERLALLAGWELCVASGGLPTGMCMLRDWMRAVAWLPVQGSRGGPAG